MTPAPSQSPQALASSRPAQLPRPLGLVAELTYRCPLHCPYCSNPTRSPAGAELTTKDWSGVFDQAAALGVVHALLTGGEPLGREDLDELVSAARRSGLYTNLITSAVGLDRDRAARLRDAGLDSVQISFQADEAGPADAVAGTTAHALKLGAARAVTDLGLPLTVNVVLHRANIDRIAQVIALAEGLGAARLELASVQFYGWAYRNRAALLPDRAQIERAGRVAADAKQRLRGTTEVLYVLPDYFADRPKPCMNGWGRRYIAVNPVGQVLPCPTAYEIPSLRFDNVRDRDLAWIWAESESFNRFRGTAWMPEPCRTCDYRETDFGGCRCQAALLTGDATNTDPACGLSPHHESLRAFVGETGVGRKGDRQGDRRPLPQLHMRHLAVARNGREPREAHESYEKPSTGCGT